MAHADWRRLVGLARPHGRPLAVATLALALGSGIGLLYPKFAGIAVDEAIATRSVAGYDLEVVALALVALFAVQGLLFGLRFYLFTVTGDRVVTNLRRRLYEAILSQEMGFFDATRTGELTSRLASDTQVLQNAVTSNLSMLLRYGAQGIGGLLFLVATSPQLSLFMLAALAVLFVFGWFYGGRVRRLSRQVQDAIAASTDVAEESIAGVRTVRSFVAEAREQRRYGEAVEESFGLARRRALWNAAFTSASTFLTFSTIALILWLGAEMVGTGEITPGELTEFILYTLIVAMSIGVLMGLYGDFMKAIGAADRVFGLLDRAPQLAEGPDPRRQPPARPRLIFESVSFAYPTRPSAGLCAR